MGSDTIESEMPEAAKHDIPSPIAQSAEPASSRKIDPVALSGLLDEWMRGDEDEQRETFEYLRQALDEDRPEGYKLFP